MNKLLDMTVRRRHNVAMPNGIKLTVRPDTKAQLERHRKAAKAKRWSVNRLYLEAADKMASEIEDQEIYAQALRTPAPVEVTR